MRDDVLPYPYKYTEKDQIYVLSGDVELTRNEDFTVSYDGSVTILDDVPVGTVLTIYRQTPLDQGSEFPQEAPFSSRKIEDALDKLTMQNQEQREALSRALKLPMTASTDLADLEMPTPEPNRSVKWNADGTALINTNFDPDTALEQTEKFKKEAEQAAKDAVAAKESITTTEETLVNTAKQATEEINMLSEETQEAIANASKHKLNSKEIGSLLISSVPQEDSDLNKADGRFITSDDECYAEFHNNYMTTQRNLTDVVTKYYRYDSYNYSRVWYSTVESTPDRFYGLTNIINAPAGTWYLLDREGTPHLKESIEVKSYYKYELINAVGHEAPQYLLWQVFAGDEQIAEPDTSHSQEFYAYQDDYIVGAFQENFVNIVVLPPDVTSEFRRIQFTQVDGDNTYYYYYKAVPVEIHAYMRGTIKDLNLGVNTAATLLQTEETVPRPYLHTTHNGSYDRITNPDFFTTREWNEANKSLDDYNRFYSAVKDDITYDTVALHDEVTVVGNPTNKGGVYSGFTQYDYLEIPKRLDTQTSFEGVVSRVPITSFDFEFYFQSSAVKFADAYVHTFLGSPTKNGGLLFGEIGTTAAATTSSVVGSLFVCWGDTVSWNVVPYNILTSKESLKVDTKYKTKLKYENSTLELWLAEEDADYELQASTNVSVEACTQTLQEVFVLGNSTLSATQHMFGGKLDLTKSSMTINGKLWWGHKVVKYATKGEDLVPTMYSSNYDRDYHKELASNIYEVNPSGYSMVGNVSITEDGWFTPNAATQYYLYGGKLADKALDFRAESEIHLSLRFRTANQMLSTDSQIVSLTYTVATYGILALELQADGVPRFYMASTNAAWKVGGAMNSDIKLKPGTEYLFNMYTNKLIKYKKNAEDATKYDEDSTGTFYKYTMSFTEWTVDNSSEPITFDLYLEHQFGSGTADNYKVSAIGTYGRATKDKTMYINVYSFNLNGRTLFLDNINVVDRPANATALPRIKETAKGDETYVVVANGVEEEVILADPKTSVDNYVATTVNPSLSTLGADLQKTLQNSYNQYNKTLTSTYNQGIKALQNASDAVRKSDLQRVECVVETYRNGNSWYRVWSDGWIEQGGYLAAAGTIQLLKEYRYANYNVSLSPIAAADPYVSARTTTTLTITGSGCMWITRGY